MDYYRCTKVDLHRELARRGYQTSGDQDVAAEHLKKDEEERAYRATTVSIQAGVPSSVYTWKPNPEFGKTVQISMLVNESIVHWTMNTFFPALQLFFASGLSCSIEGSHLADAIVGMDPELRFRMTDLTHEEDGCLTNTIIPKRPTTTTSIRILEATLACRQSIAVKETNQISNFRPVTTIAREQHLVVGLRLEGMTTIAYVWAKVPQTTVKVGGRMWGHVRVAGMKDDVPVPFVRFPQTGVRPGGESTVVLKKSQASPPPII